MREASEGRIEITLDRKSSIEFDPRKVELEIREKFNYAHYLSEKDFNALCVTNARVGNEFDCSWTEKDYSHPCVVVATIQNHISRWHYIIFWKDGNLLLGSGTKHVDDMNADWKEVITSRGAEYYCTCAKLF